jgi:DNA polymerase-1
MANFLLIIDGSSLLSTQYYGNMPPAIRFESDEAKREKLYSQLLHTSTGKYTNGVLGFFRSLFNILREQKPSHVVIAWDLGRDTFRREISEDYKGTRKETPHPLKEQFATCQELCEKMGFVQLMDHKYEADDFCGSVARKFENMIPVRILTKDKDYFQLITKQTHIWLLMSSKDKVNELFDKYEMDRNVYNFPDKVFRINRSILKSEYGYYPETAVTVKAIAGDASDNIKGVPGIGEDVAIKLANEYKTIDALYAAIEGLDKKQEKELKEYWKTIGISRSPLNALLKEDDNNLVGKKAAKQSELLGTIKTDVDLDEYFFFGITLDQLEVTVDSQVAKAALEEYEIKTVNTTY